MNKRAPKKPRNPGYSAMRLYNAAMNVGRPLRVPGAIGSFVLQDTQASNTLGWPNAADGVPEWTGPCYLVMKWTPTSVRAFRVYDPARPVYTLGSPHLETIMSQVTGIRPMRQTLTLRNVSASDAVAGTVKVLNIPETLSLDFGGGETMSVATKTAIEQLMRSHPEGRTYGASEFRKSKSLSLLPASSNGFRQYHPSMQLGNTTQKFNTDLASPAMNTMIIEFSHAPNNKYEFTLHTQDACHVISNGPLQNQRQMPQNVDETRHQEMIQAGQAAASMLVDDDEGL